MPKTHGGAFVTGDIVLIDYRADDVDGTVGNGNDQAFVWVPLVNLGPNEQIFFTDAGTQANGDFRAQEGAISYRAPDTGLDAGTVMLVEFSGGAGAVDTYNFTHTGPEFTPEPTMPKWVPMD